MMNQRCAYWAPVAPDGYGSLAHDAPVADIPCRWETRDVLYRDVDGSDAVAQDVVYLEYQVQVEGLLFLQVSGSVASIAGAHEIRAVQMSTGFAGERLVKALL